ncbi:MAG: LbtU family siderophore porin [Gammaproteobacteria bacterium]|nr:MAG: LbtU family siderophore porin [Gammaproteobacteria bacterium]
MSIQLKPFAVALCLAGFAAAPVFAATTDTNPDNAQIQAELAKLQKEVKSLKAQVKTSQQVAKKSSKKSSTSTAGSSTGTSDMQDTLSPEQVKSLISQEREYLPFDLDVPGQAFVSTGPYVGVPIQYAGSELVVNSPSVNTDVQLLSIRKSIHKQLEAMGGELFKEPYHSHLLLSGVVEGQAGYNSHGGSANLTNIPDPNPSTVQGNMPSTSNIDVTNVSLDAFFIGPSDWTLGFVELSYSDSTPSSTDSYTVSNSNVYVNKAFVTIGNFSQSPFYGTFGQYYVPFGVYSSVMVSDTLPKLLARTKERAIEVGFNQQGDSGFYGSTYIFRGDAHTESVSKINNGGLNLGYQFDKGPFSGTLGAGVLANLADSGGMQAGNGFSSSEEVHNHVPAYDVHALFGLSEKWTLIMEYVIASTNFNPDDMSFNGHGAKPSALDTQLAYSFYILDDKPSSIAVGYGKSDQALALEIPLTRTSVTFNTSIWRNTLQSLEFRHDKNYAASDTANGPGGPGGTCTASACASTGEADNAVTAQFDYYF